ncbi:M1 family metallopeptidase [Novispirillum sp. DQ9]|uniref:M1 family metallopeptidase n=1 Tax=Novispirillum sp. DQ9 TaxID=3398612 RepID=UPI003C7A97CE
MNRTISMAVAAALALASVLLPSSLRAAAVEEVVLTLAPADSVLTGHASLSVPAGAPDLRLDLDDAFTLTAVRVGERTLVPPRDPGGGRFVLPGEGPWTVEVDWRGVLPPPDPPAVAPQGSYLPAEIAWYPRPDDGAVPRRLTVRTPAGHRAVVTGALLEEEVGADGAIATFAPYTDEPTSVFAGPYAVTERMVDGRRLRTYFPPGMEGLADGYLEDTARHIARWSAEIGPYPYDGFAIVAAPYPVGWGFPGLTYVSERILAQPFMRARSLPHEILHSWWGNAVTPDYASGNWAEGLTTYMADYALADEAGRRRLRLEWLRDYAALPAERDRPVTTFTAKAHGADQVIGYGKVAFIFHMLERQLGEDVFRRGVARFYAAHRGSRASWADLRAVLEAEAGEDLAAFFDQWLTRTGAPVLTLEHAQAGGGAVTVVVGQDDPPYALRLPVAVTTAEGTAGQVVPVASLRSTVAVAVEGAVEGTGPPRAVTLDPDFHVFRRLSPQETPPILRDVTLAAAPAVLLPDDPAARAVAQDLAVRLFGQPVAVVTAKEAEAGSGPLLVVSLDGATSSLGGLEGEPAEVAGRGTARAWVRRLPGGRPVLVVQAATVNALSTLLRPLPHYGRESWLVFDGGRVIDKGLWDPPQQPLRKALSR